MHGARSMVLESAPVDLRAMVEGTVEMVAAEANKKGLELAYLLDEPLLSRRVLGDAIRIRQARPLRWPGVLGGLMQSTLI